MSSTERQLHLLSLLQTRRELPGALLASRLNISDRTVRRDIDRLRAMGYNIRATMGPDGGYQLEAGNVLPPIVLDDDQAMAVAIALSAATTLGAGIEEAAIRALGAIRQVMPSPLRHRLDAFELTAVGSPREAAPVTASLDVLVDLATAISDRQTLQFDYTGRGGVSGGEEPTARRAEPHHLAISHGRWYLVAWDLDRDDWRLFSVDRVSPRIKRGARFIARSVPGGAVSEFVSAKFKGSRTNEWACRGTVIIHLPAHEVLPFAGDGKVTAVDEGSCTFESGSWSWGALAASFGQFEVAMEVVGPPELAAAFATLAERYRQASNARPIA